LFYSLNACDDTSPAKIETNSIEPATSHQSQVEPLNAHRGLLRVALTPSPFNYTDEEGQLKGILAEQLIANGKALGREIDFVSMPYLRAVQALKSGHIDMMYALNVEESSTRIPDNVIMAGHPESSLPLSLYSLADLDIEVHSWQETRDHLIGSIRLIGGGERKPQPGQGETLYFNSVDHMTKALLAKRVDLITLDPAGADNIEKKNGIRLRRVFDYGSMQVFPIFSPSSTRIEDPLALCQHYATLHAKLVDEGGFDDILTRNNMVYLKPFMTAPQSRSQRCLYKTRQAITEQTDD